MNAGRLLHGDNKLALLPIPSPFHLHVAIYLCLLLHFGRPILRRRRRTVSIYGPPPVDDGHYIGQREQLKECWVRIGNWSRMFGPLFDPHTHSHPDLSDYPGIWFRLNFSLHAHLTAGLGAREQEFAQ